LKNVPAEVCANCGDYYLASDVSADVMSRAEAAVASGVEVQILRSAA